MIINCLIAHYGAHLTFTTTDYQLPETIMLIAYFLVCDHYDLIIIVLFYGEPISLCVCVYVCVRACDQAIVDGYNGYEM